MGYQNLFNKLFLLINQSAFFFLFFCLQYGTLTDALIIITAVVDGVVDMSIKLAQLPIYNRKLTSLKDKDCGISHIYLPSVRTPYWNMSI